MLHLRPCSGGIPSPASSHQKVEMGVPITLGAAWVCLRGKVLPANLCSSHQTKLEAGGKSFCLRAPSPSGHVQSWLAEITWEGVSHFLSSENKMVKEFPGAPFQSSRGMGGKEVTLESPPLFCPFSSSPPEKPLFVRKTFSFTFSRKAICFWIQTDQKETKAG